MPVLGFCGLILMENAPSLDVIKAVAVFYFFHYNIWDSWVQCSVNLNYRQQIVF